MNRRVAGGTGRALALAGGLLLAGCAVRAEVVVNPAAADTYALCDDTAAKSAWAAAQPALAAGRPADALVDLRTVVERCPRFVRGHCAYQDAARTVGGAAAQSMLQFYRNFADAGSPVPGYLQARLADTSYGQGSALQAVLARHPRFGWAHLSLGRVQRRQGQLLQAVDSFQQAVANDPSLPEARLERAQLLVELGRDEEAARDYQAYLRAAPDDAASQRAYLVLLLYRLARIDEGLQLLDRLQQQEPADQQLRMHRAAALWRAKRPREAVAAYLAVLDADPEQARALWNVGMLYYEVLPRSDAERAVCWPKAAAAFQLYLQVAKPQDGLEQFERTLAVPYRLRVIARQLGAPAPSAPALGDLALPPG